MLEIGKRIEKVRDYIEPNLFFVGLVGLLGFPTYYVIWKFLFPQTYENFTMRLLGFALFAPLMFFKSIPEKIKAHFDWYFLAAFTYTIPFFFCFMLIKNEFSFVWHLSTIASIFLLIIILYDWLLITLSILLGTIFAILCVLITDGKIDMSNFNFEAIPIYFFSLFGGLLFNYRNELSNQAKATFLIEKNKSMKALAGSIAHELRNPLSAIGMCADNIKMSINEGQKLIANELENVSKQESSQIESNLSAISRNFSDIAEVNQYSEMAVKQANSVINMILADLSDKPLLASDFAIFRVKEILPKIIASYSFASEKERQKVRFIESNEYDFAFKAVFERLQFIIFNLLKNSLYYLHQFPQAEVAVGFEPHQIDGQKFNTIFVLDNGPGIPKEILPKLFEDFFTSGKTSGTGLGLAFCKKNMKQFGGDIICESRYGEGKQGETKFSLLFPVIKIS